MPVNLYIFCHLLGLMTALGFPPYGVWPLTWLAGGAMVWIFLEHSELSQRKTMAWAFANFMFSTTLYGFYWVSYTLHEFGALPWVVAGLLLLLVLLILASISGFMGYMWAFFLSKKPKFIPVLFWLGLWLVVYEVIDVRLFPWVHAQSVGSDPYLLASVRVLDTWMWSLIFLVFVLLLGRILHRSSQSAEVLSWKLLGKVAGLFVVFFVPLYGIGYWQKTTLEKEYAARQPVALLQGNVGNYQKKLTKLKVEPTLRVVMSIHRDLVEEAAIVFNQKLNSDGTGAEPWVFWPETSFPGFPMQSIPDAEALKSFVLMTRGLHVVGAYEEGTIDFAGSPKEVDFNVAALFHEKAGFVSSYKKHIRVPFGEYIPFDEYLPKAYEWIPTVNHFGRGDTFLPLVHPDSEGPVFIPLICYEILFKSFVDRFVKEVKAKYPNRDIILVNPTNDSWYGPTSEPFQHSLLARWSAVRHGLPLLRPTNTGLSQVVAPWGEVMASGPRDDAWVIQGELPVRKVQMR